MRDSKLRLVTEFDIDSAAFQMFWKTNMTNSSLLPVSNGRILRICLWAAQILVSGFFALAASMKIGMSIEPLAKIFPWMGQVPSWVVRGTGIFDLAGALGLVLPAVTRVAPRLTIWAAWGCSGLQFCAILFHFSRGEAVATPLNFILLALSLFIVWGRSLKASIYAGGSLRKTPG
ncbi:DoxX family protein [Paraburkholderia phymatum]|uniref:DoxX family protein n=1 Tax=Paraburkholderia phymatum (strain DSM 17167 / CIP 108236 / LMG 21445 / STM815) TaxID=391038 RepID=B2JL65_PARP8|nr:DoxX family protein [Paraburkholderia phymatum]ACC74033.1 conserved hypothetical protein [Paraburkholderia phymatum STM815]